jgi:hypothetical protein
VSRNFFMAGHVLETFSWIDKVPSRRRKSSMSTTPVNQSDAAAAPLSETPDRSCTWCKIPMMKRLVAGGQFIHYTCPQCIFQHTSKRTRSAK